MIFSLCLSTYISIIYISHSIYMLYAQSLQLCPTVCNLWMAACQAPLSTGFSRQEYWSGLPCPPPGDLSDPRNPPALQADSSSLSHWGSMCVCVCVCTVNFQMSKLDLEKAEEPEIKLPTSVRSQKKQENSRKTSTSALLITLKPLTVDHRTLGKILKEIGIRNHLTCLLRNLYAGQEATVRTRHGTIDCFQIGKGVR